MSEIKTLIELDWRSTLIAIFAVIIGFLAVKKIIGELCKSIGYVPPWRLEREEIKRSLAAISQEVRSLQTERASDQERLCTYECKMEECQAKIMECINSLKIDLAKNNIERMRYEILDFANRVRKSDSNKESYDHILETYDNYMIMLKENGLENGRVDAAMKYIKEKYTDHLENGFPY